MGRVGQPVLQDKSENGYELGIFLGVGGGQGQGQGRGQGQGQEAGAGGRGRAWKFCANYLAVETVGF
jgi:hypothetical protein